MHHIVTMAAMGVSVDMHEGNVTHHTSAPTQSICTLVWVIRWAMGYQGYQVGYRLPGLPDGLWVTRVTRWAMG